MTPERAHAYQRVIQTLKEMGPSNLLGEEQERMRFAADNLIFSRDLAQDAPAREAMADIERLGRASQTADVGRMPRQCDSPTTSHNAGPASSLTSGPLDS